MKPTAMNNKVLITLLRSLVVLSAAVAVLSLSACASFQSTPEDTVRRLATQRWEYLLARKYEQAYEMAVPSYRKLKSVSDYVDNTMAVPVRWKSAEVVRVECETQTCKVTVKVVSQVMLPTRYKGPLESGFDETWVYEDGRWWMFETR